MYTPIPLEDATFTEVLARVAFRLLELEYRKWKYEPETLYIPFQALAFNLAVQGFGQLSTFVASYLYYHTKYEFRAEYWRWRIIVRARGAERNRRAGKPWKRVP